jgi:hypothetical protein
VATADVDIEENPEIAAGAVDAGWRSGLCENAEFGSISAAVESFGLGRLRAGPRTSTIRSGVHHEAPPHDGATTMAGRRCGADDSRRATPYFSSVLQTLSGALGYSMEEITSRLAA